MTATASVQELVDVAYGQDADLYKDVLKVSRNASKEDIQSAFIDRRYELYELLQNASQLSSTPRSALNETDGSMTSFVSDRHFTEKKMDALVATFRTLYDPAKRLEYNASMNAIPRASSKSPTNLSTCSSIQSARSMDQLETNSHKIMSHSFDNSSPAYSKIQRKSSTRRELFTSQDGSKRVMQGVLKTPKLGSKSADPERDLPLIASKRKSKRMNKGVNKQTSNFKPKESYSPTLPSTKVELFRNEGGNQNQSISVNISNASLRQTYERITKQDEGSTPPTPQQQKSFHGIENRKKSKKKRSSTRQEKIKLNGNDQGNTPIEYLKTESRSKGQVTWKDSDEVENVCENVTTPGVHSGCLDLHLVERPSDAVDSGSLVGFLRSSGFESQAFLVQELRNEVRGSIADTLMAVDQVLNAFKIADDDIDAVVGNIRQERNCLAKHIRHN